MKSDLWDFLSYRTILDLVMALIFLAVVLLYLWALAARPVSLLKSDRRDMAPHRSPVPAYKPMQMPLERDLLV